MRQAGVAPLTAEEAEAEPVMTRLWWELRQEPALEELLALLPADRPVGLADAIPLLALVLTTPVLQGPVRQLAVIDGLARAHARARGLAEE